MSAIELPRPSSRAVTPRPLVVILGGSEAARLAAAAAMSLADAILIGHQGAVPPELAPRVRRLEDSIPLPCVTDTLPGALQVGREATPLGKAFALALQERREHLLLLDLDRPNDLDATAAAGGDASLAMTVEAVESLFQLLEARGQSLRIDSLNRDCPVSLTLGCGMVSPQMLRAETGISVVLVPLIPRDCDAAVANFELWNDPQAFPRDTRGPAKADLAFVFNCPADPELEQRLRDAFAASAAARRCFRTLRVAFLGLEGEDDRYIRRATGPMPRYGYKAGPNLLFFGALAQLREWGYEGFAALMEVDCRPLRRGWLDALGRLAQRHPDAWVIGSIYRGHGLLGGNIKRHLNGNAIYAVGSAAFHQFLYKGYLAWLQARITHFEPDLAFDTAWDRFLESADPERANTAEWRVAQHVLPRFVSCDEIVNIAGDPEIRGQIAFSRETLRRAFPAAYLVHGPIAPEDRNLDLATLPEALSRMAIDNAVGHAALGLRVEEWLTAPGLSRRGAASWTYAVPGPETVAGLLLTASDGVMAAGGRLVAHVAVRADRRRMMRFSLVPDSAEWRASSRDIFLREGQPKRFRIELTLAEATRFVGFRVAAATGGADAPLTLDFDELRLERLDESGRHEGGLSLGLTSLAAANYGALSVIGSSPVPPAGGSAPPDQLVAEVESAPPAPTVWMPRLAMSEPDEAHWCRLVVRSAGAEIELAWIKVEQEQIAAISLTAPEAGDSSEIPVPKDVHELASLAGSDLPEAKRTRLETLAVHWGQITRLTAGGGEAEVEVSPDAGVAAKADPASLLAIIDPLWHHPGGRRDIEGILSAVLDMPSAEVSFPGLFHQLRRAARGDDPGAAWQLAQAEIEGRGLRLPRGAAVAVAELLDDPGRLQAFANHLFAREEHDAAAEICRMTLAQGAPPRDAYLVLARSEGAQGAMEACGAALRLGVNRHPTDSALIMELVKWYGARGEADAAADAAWQLAQTWPEHPDVVAEIAARLVLAGRHDEVMTFGKEYLSREPDLRLAHCLLSAASQIGRHADALRLARTAVELGAPPDQVVGPVIAAAARLWEVGDGAQFAEDLLSRNGEPSLLSTLLDARLQIIEAQRGDGSLETAAVAELLDWLHARRERFGGDLMLRALELAAGCGLRKGLLRGLREWRAVATPDDAVRIAQALLGGTKGAGSLPSSGNELADLLVARAAREGNGQCEALLAVEMVPGSSALRLAVQFAGFESGDAELVRHHGLLQPAAAFDRRLPLWPLRGEDGTWPRDPMTTYAMAERRRVLAGMARPGGDVEWPRISVVLPSLDQGDTIEDSLLSVLNQHYPDIEVTVVDGGSCDGTLDTLARYSDRVRTLVKPGLSQSEALAFGFRETEADLLCWLNTDDLLMPGALFAVAGLWLTTPADVIVGDCLHFREADVVDLVIADRKHPPLDLAQLLDVEGNWLQGRYFTQPEVFFSRAAYERAGREMDAGLNYALDYDLWLRMAATGAQSVSLPRPLAAFRRHGLQKTARQFDAFRELVAVRDRHPTARRSVPRAPSRPSGVLALCPWDPPAGSPLAALLASAEPVPLPGEEIVLLPPHMAHEHRGPVLDMLGLGGPLPHGAFVAEQLRLRSGGATAWIWSPEIHFAEKLRLSRLFARVVPTDAASGAYLRNLDPAVPALAECATLDPQRRASEPMRPDGSVGQKWLHLDSGKADPIARLLPSGGRVIRPAALFTMAQGDGGTAREFLASFSVISMTAPGTAIPSLAYETAALGRHTVVFSPAAAYCGKPDADGIFIASIPGGRDEAAKVLTTAMALPRPALSLKRHDLIARAAEFLACAN